MKGKASVSQQCLTDWDPTDYSPPGSSVHGIHQARVLEWAVMSFSREAFPSRDRTQVSCFAGRLFTVWGTREAQQRQMWVCAKWFPFLGLSATPWTEALQAPLSKGFSRQEYWSGCHACLQGTFPTQGSNLSLSWLLQRQAGSLPLAPPNRVLFSKKIFLFILLYLIYSYILYS